MNKILTTAYLKSNLGNEYMKSICEIYVANKKACCFFIRIRRGKEHLIGLRHKENLKKGSNT